MNSIEASMHVRMTDSVLDRMNGGPLVQGLAGGWLCCGSKAARPRRR